MMLEEAGRYVIYCSLCCLNFGSKKLRKRVASAFQ